MLQDGKEKQMKAQDIFSSWRRSAACRIEMPTAGDASEESSSMRGSRALLPLNWSVAFLLLCFFCSPSSSSPPAVQGSQFLVCNSSDRDALVAFSRRLDSGVPRWSSNASLNCCRWYGVRCGVSSSSRNSSSASEPRVVELELGKLDLKGAVDWKTFLGLDELRTLNLSQNSLGGVITSELFQLRRLEVLDLSGNGFHGSIPDAFDGLRKLQILSARSNLFTGRLPASVSSCSMLTSLDLGNNLLTGRIGLNCARLARLRTLRLESNRFVGQIPRKLSSCSELQTLNLAKNRLHGRVPWSFKNLQALSSLSLSANALSNVSQALKALSECRNLTIVVLSKNFLEETLPDDGIGGFENLKALVVANCSLHGHIPSWLRGRAELRLVDLSFNSLSGGVPPWLGDFVYLFYLDLSNNLLGGVLPDALANLRSLASLNVSRTDDSPIEFPFYERRNRSVEVRFRRFSGIRPTLDLSHNGINGTILKDFGNLTGLTVLDLSSNHFSGSIPEELSGMRSLESLDLSVNNLSGRIPSILDILTFLSEFSVACNCLQGQVPESRQFLTFSSSSYEGNPGLCGGPLARCAPRSPRYEKENPGLCGRYCTPTPPVNGNDNSEVFKITFMPLPYGIGVLIGFIPTVTCVSYCVYRKRKKKERRD